jgi:hypothetical protein
MDFGEEKLTVCLVEIELRSFGHSVLGLVPVPNEFSLLSCYSAVWTWLYMQLYIHLASSVHGKSRFNSETKAYVTGLTSILQAVFSSRNETLGKCRRIP